MFWIWVAICALSIIAEIATAELVSVWFTLGGLVAMLLSCIPGVGWYWQILAFMIISVVCLVFLRRVAKKYLLKGVDEKTNADSLIGKTVRMETPASDMENGSAKIGGVVWTVREVSGAPLAVGEDVCIIALEGNKLLVSRVETSEKE